MSFDKEHQVSGIENPIGNVEPPKSRKKLWIFGGLGCFGLILVVCVGGAVVIWLAFGKPTLDFMNENMVLIDNSEAAVEALGSPITRGAPTQEQDGSGSMTFSLPVSGPKAKGTLVFKGTYGAEGWTRDDIYLEVDGEKIDLSDAEDIFNLDINDGQ